MMEDFDVSELEKTFRQQVHFCQEMLEGNPKTQEDLVVKSHVTSRAAVSLLQRYNLASDNEDINENPKQLLILSIHNFTQSVLDSTYYRECQLFNREFSCKSCLSEVVSINHTLSLPVRLCGSPESAFALLGTELLECLFWRIGALLYMYCHSTFEKEERRKEMNKQVFLNCCCTAVGYLCLMLRVRAPLGKNEDYISHDLDMVQLLEQGIYSDIHMLALMYAGDLCYWAWLVSSPSFSAEATKTTITSPPNSLGTKGKKEARSGSDVKFEQTGESSTEVTLKGITVEPSVVCPRIQKDNDSLISQEETSAIKATVSKLKETALSDPDDCSPLTGDQTVHSQPLGGVSRPLREIETGSDQGQICGDREDLSGSSELLKDSEPCTFTSTTTAGDGVTNRNSKDLRSVESCFNKSFEETDNSELSRDTEPLKQSSESIPTRETEHTADNEASGGRNSEIDPSLLDFYHVMRHTHGKEHVTRWKSEFDPIKQGQEVLSKYIGAARGPLKNHGWNYSRAVELIVKLKRAEAAIRAK